MPTAHLQRSKTPCPTRLPDDRKWQPVMLKDGILVVEQSVTRQPKGSSDLHSIYCTSAEGQDSPNEYPGCDTKQSDGEVPVMLELWGKRSTLHCHRSQVHSGPGW